MADFTGTSGDNTQVGTSDSDFFDFSQGGSDTLTGGGGAGDTYNFGAAFDAGDMVIGAAGTVDVVNLEGDYSAGLTVSLSQLVEVDLFQLASGFTYDLTLADGVGGGQSGLQIRGQEGSVVHLDASAVTTSSIELDVSTQGASFIGGGGGDFVVYASVAEGAHDRVDGGAGTDHLSFVSQTVDLHLHARQMQNIEILQFTGSVKVVDANVAAGQTLAVLATGAGAIGFDGHKETDGAFSIAGSDFNDTLIGGKGADTLSGSGGTDVVTGGKGADFLIGGAGATTFVYTALSDSTRLVFDTIQLLDSNDTIDLSRVDARSDKAGNQAFTLVDQFSHHAGELTLSFDSGTNTTVLAGDVDGNGKADLVIHILGDHHDFTGIVL